MSVNIAVQLVSLAWQLDYAWRLLEPNICNLMQIVSVLSDAAGVGCKSSRRKTEIVGGKCLFSPEYRSAINPGFKASVL